jgi:hypothetical protein
LQLFEQQSLLSVQLAPFGARVQPPPPPPPPLPGLSHDETLL